MSVDPSFAPECEVSCRRSELDMYRRGWVPGADAGLAGMWVGAVLTDANNQDYWGLRGADDFVPGMTHVVSPITGFRVLTPETADPPHLFDEYSGIDWYEPLSCDQTSDSVVLRYPSGRIERGEGRFRWYDATDRWIVEGRTVSDVFTVHVPAQEGVSDAVYYRHEVIQVAGSVDGVAVSGFAHQDYAYGPPGMVYAELPIARQLQGMWVSWMHEYTDGELGGGCFWQGRDGVTFGPGYELRQGITAGHDDVVATPTFDDAGRLSAMSVSIGGAEYSFVFDRMGSPLHYFGKLERGSDHRPVARSWCWVEYAGGMLTPEILDFAMEPFKLARGRQ